MAELSDSICLHIVDNSNYMRVAGRVATRILEELPEGTAYQSNNERGR